MIRKIRARKTDCGVEILKKKKKKVHAVNTGSWERSDVKKLQR